ncbi:MAG: DUF2251 domain-containing protein [Acidobacteriota bacterium]
MKGAIAVEEMIIVGRSVLIESRSATNAFAVFFEDEGDTAYFYALDTEREDPILDALHIYNVANVTDANSPSRVQIAWSNDGLKSALIINGSVHAVFDFYSKRGYCRTGFPPPIGNWSQEGHEWSDNALKLFS